MIPPLMSPCIEKQSNDGHFYIRQDKIVLFLFNEIDCLLTIPGRGNGMPHSNPKPVHPYLRAVEESSCPYPPTTKRKSYATRIFLCCSRYCDRDGTLVGELNSVFSAVRSSKICQCRLGSPTNLLRNLIGHNSYAMRDTFSPPWCPITASDPLTK